MSTLSTRKKPFVAQPPVPSIHDTHCDGAGLEHSTKPWSRSMKFYYRWLAEDNTDVPLPPQVDLKGKWAIVSGSNSGIGREAAYTLALWGANVILACRNPPPHEDHPEAVIEDFVSKSKGAIQKSQLEWWEVDYGSFDSVGKFGKRWIESGRTLEILCNNAGLNINKYVKTVDGYDMVNQVSSDSNNFARRTSLTKA
jgi:short chain dehydrogenase